MKKILFIVLLGMLSIPAINVSAQCTDTIGVNRESIQGQYPNRDLVLSGWGVNEFPYAFCWSRIWICDKRLAEFRPTSGPPTIVSNPVYLMDSCTGWILVDIIDINTIQYDQTIFYQVCMMTNEGNLYESRIVEAKRIGIGPRHLVNLSSVPVVTKSFKRTTLTGDESILSQDLESFNPSITRIGREFTIESNDEFYQLYVFDLNGKLLFNQSVESTSFNLSLPNLSQGMYIFQMSNGIEKIAERVFVE